MTRYLCYLIRQKKLTFCPCKPSSVIQLHPFADFRFGQACPTGLISKPQSATTMVLLCAWRYAGGPVIRKPCPEPVKSLCDFSMLCFVRMAFKPRKVKKGVQLLLRPSDRPAAVG